MVNRRQFITGFGLGFVAKSIPAIPLVATAAEQAIRLSGLAFGTTWQLTVSEDSPLYEIMELCNHSYACVNSALSPWQKHSEVTTFNASDTTDWVSVSDHFSTVIASALQIARLSNGYFDPTVGPIVGRAGFGPINSDINDVKFTQLHVQSNAVRKLVPTITLDPCGIAKGYALDIIVDELTKLGVTNYFLELGGDIRTGGQHPVGRAWVAGIESPKPATSDIAHYLQLRNKALATSGHKHNSYSSGDTVTSHIVDPKISASANSALLSVSVIADSAMLADAWATALMAAGEKKAFDLALRNNISALLMMGSRSGAVESVPISGFDSHLL